MHARMATLLWSREWYTRVMSLESRKNVLTPSKKSRVYLWSVNEIFVKRLTSLPFLRAFADSTNNTKEK